MNREIERETARNRETVINREIDRETAKDRERQKRIER